MAYSLLRISWTMAGTVRIEICTWKAINGEKKHAGLILLTIFEWCRKKRTRELLKGWKMILIELRDRWI